MNKRAVLKEFGTSASIAIEQIALPEPQAGEVRIRVEASTISSTDITIRKGLYPLLTDKPPFVLGYDFVGVVDKLGEGVTHLAIGERVADICQIGGNAQFICRNAANLLKIDPNIAPTDAAPLILSGMTAYQIFKYAAQLTSGQTFLVHGGSGAVGNILLQLCQLNGVKTVSTTSKSKMDMVSKLGATALDYNAVDYFQALKTASGAGFDAALDFSNQTSINQSFRLVKKGGKMVLCGLLTTQKQMEKKTLLNFLLFGFEFGGMMLKKAFWNRFSSKTVDFFGIVDSKRDFPERYQNDLNALCALVKNGQLKPVIHEIIPIDDVPKGHDLLEKGFVKGQIIVKMS